MKDELTGKQIRFYRENGFLVIEDFLDRQELNRWRNTIKGAVARRKDQRLPRQGVHYKAASALENEKWKKVLSQHINLWQSCDEMKAFSLSPKLGRMACQLEGVSGIRIWHDQAMEKPAWGEPTGWHLDAPVFSFTSDHAVTFWFALEDATLLNGCLHYIAGSQKLKRQKNPTSDLSLNGLREIDPEWAAMDPVPCPVTAGGLVIHNGYTAHATNGNITPRSRPAFTISYMPDGSAFNGKQNILTDEQMLKLKVGDLFEDDLETPLVWTESR